MTKIGSPREIASFGHGARQAPQRKQSWLILVAISLKSFCNSAESASPTRNKDVSRKDAKRAKLGAVR